MYLFRAPLFVRREIVAACSSPAIVGFAQRGGNGGTAIACSARFFLIGLALASYPLAWEQLFRLFVKLIAHFVPLVASIKCWIPPAISWHNLNAGKQCRQALPHSWLSAFFFAP